MEALARTAGSELDPRDRIADLFRRYHRQVFLAAHRVTGNATDAEDALQTVFMRILRRGEAAALSEEPGSYLHRAAINAALDILRGRRGSQTARLEDVEIIADDASRADQERQAGGGELRERLRRALGRLSPDAAEAFALRYFEGYANHEIARMLGTTRSTVGVMLHRARLRLRNDIRDFQEKRHG